MTVAQGRRREVSRYEFTNPDRWTWLDSGPFSSGYAVPSSGGLYRTRALQHDHAVIVPPPAKTLGDLGVKPLLRGRDRSVNAIGAVLSIIRLWSEAHVTGGLLSVTRRQAVLLALANQIFEIVCGKEWARAEEMLHRPGGLKQLNRALSPTPPGTSFAAGLLADLPAYGAQATSDRVDRFASSARRLLKLKQPGDHWSRLGPVQAARFFSAEVSDPTTPTGYANSRFVSRAHLRPSTHGLLMTCSVDYNGSSACRF